MSTIRIQDDLFAAVNQEWIDQAEIPADRPSVGGFIDLDIAVEKTLRGDIEEMCRTGVYPNETLQYACALYRSAADIKRRNRAGIRPALPMLKKIEKLQSVTDLNRHLKEFALDGMPLPFVFSVSPDMKDTSKKMVYLQGPETILPDTAYYQPEMAEQKKALLGMWEKMARGLLKKTRLGEQEQEETLRDALRFDEILAGLVKSSEEWSEYAKMYNPISSRKAAMLLKPLRLSKLWKDLFGQIPGTVSAADPRFLQGFSTLFNEENFGLYKHWAYLSALTSAANYLSEELRDLGTSYRRALTGVAEMPSAEKFAYRLAAGVYDQPIGLYYGEKYFGQAAKKDVVEMVEEIIETYKKRVAANEFLQEETKKKAICKLGTMRIKMGYPDKVEKVFAKMTFDEGEALLSVVSSLARIRREEEYAAFGDPVDRSRWEMPGHMVNACYDPFANDITFPAGILQEPFYSVKQSRSKNLGGIGAVIGHEISHAFDNNGAGFDEHGNLSNWWTKQDRANFRKKTQAMIRQFEGITLPWGPLNSTLVVSENIADNGGMAVTLQIMEGMKDASFEEYFVNWAKVWCEKAKPEYLALKLNIDVHAPHVLRANMPPRNFDAWYATFGVTKKDKMYLAPAKRLIIW